MGYTLFVKYKITKKVDTEHTKENCKIVYLKLLLSLD